MTATLSRAVRYLRTGVLMLGASSLLTACFWYPHRGYHHVPAPVPVPVVPAPVVRPPVPVPIVPRPVVPVVPGPVIRPVIPFAYIPAPPIPRREVVPALPYPGAVWQSGYWAWRGARHVWVPGYYVRPRPGHVWRPYRSYERDGRWVHEPGGWYRP